MFTVITKNNFCKEGRLVDPNSDPKFTKAWFQDGVKLEYSRNLEFNNKIYNLFDKGPDEFKVIDFACGGGQFVLDCFNDGCLAIGLDGYEIYRKHELAAWPIIPNNLFEADLSEPFQISYDNKPFVADVITSWEFMEHLYEEDLHGVLCNIKLHLKQGGYYICGISTRDEWGHFLLRNNEWWLNRFREIGLIQQPDLVSYFGSDWVRNLEDSMYFVLRNENF